MQIFVHAVETSELFRTTVAALLLISVLILPDVDFVRRHCTVSMCGHWSPLLCYVIGGMWNVDARYLQ